MKHIQNTITALLLMVFGALAFYSCSKNDPDVPNPDSKQTSFDDLDYFLNSIMDRNPEGQFLHYTFGEAIYPNDPEHLYVGVDNIAQAREHFLSWFAPDVEKREEGNAITCSLTDKEGNAQGIVYFTPGTGSKVADVTVSNDTRIRNFSKLSFILNSAWPFNSADSKWKKFDIVKNVDLKEISGMTGKFNMVCIREAGNGVKPMFVAIPKYKRPCDTADHQDIYKSKYCPSLGKAQTIGSIIQKDKNLWEKVFEEAGLAHPNSAAWIDHTHLNGVQFWDYIYLYSNEYYGDRQTQKAKDGRNFLLKIDWVDDGDIHDGGSY